jgi:acyl-CoA thioester hydrolase
VSEAPFRHQLRVRYVECDMQGHVFNANWLAYFDTAFNELWREALGDYLLMTQRGIDLVVGEANVRYLAPARFDEVLDIEVTVERLGNTAITTRYRAFRADRLLVDSVIRHVCVDAAGYTKTPIPDWVRDGLSRFLIEEKAVESSA